MPREHLSSSPAALLVAALLVLLGPALEAFAEAPAEGRPVIATGSVPDEATKAAIIARLSALYGAQRVIDQIAVENVVAPPNWDQHLVAMLDENVLAISPGEIHVDGNTVRISGEVASEAGRLAVANRMAGALNPTYTIRNQLEVGARPQALLDAALADRIVEFRSGSAALTARGQQVLDEMAEALGGLGDSRVELIGHTDAIGDRRSNIQLSLDRAGAVKQYLEGLGVPGSRLSVRGAGPDDPVADNDTEEGRARNRRIEFRVLP